MRGRPFLAIVAVFLVWLGLTWAGSARAVEEASGELPPRDVAVVVQPSAARMPPLPDDFEHIDHGWLSLEFPSSVRPRVAALVAMADEIRSRLAEDTAQPVLDRVLVRVVRSPQQMAELAPDGAPPLPYAAAMAYPSLRVAILAMQAPDTWEAPDLGELLAHELTHLALSDATA